MDRLGTGVMGDIPGKSLGMGSADPVSFLLNAIIMTHNRCSNGIY